MNIKNKRLKILEDLKSGELTIKEADDKLYELLVQMVVSSYDGLDKKKSRESRKAFKDYMTFCDISFSDGFQYAIKRIKSHWNY